MAVFLTTEVNTTNGLLLITVEETDLEEGSNALIHYHKHKVECRYILLSAENLGTPSLASSTIVLLVAQYPVPESIHFTEMEYLFYVSENSDPTTHVGYVFLKTIPSHAEP